MGEMNAMRERFAGDREVCQECFLAYEIGWHETDDEGRFPSGGHDYLSLTISS